MAQKSWQYQMLPTHWLKYTQQEQRVLWELAGTKELKMAALMFLITQLVLTKGLILIQFFRAMFLIIITLLII